MNKWSFYLIPNRLFYGINSLHFQGYLLWNSLPKHFKESDSLAEFKKQNWDQHF